MRLWKNLYGTNGEDKIHPDEVAIITAGTLDSGDRNWHNVKGFRVYYFGSVGAQKGYPSSFGMLIHLNRTDIIWQIYITDQGDLWTRQANSRNNADKMLWKNI